MTNARDIVVNPRQGSNPDEGAEKTHPDISSDPTEQETPEVSSSPTSDTQDQPETTGRLTVPSNTVSTADLIGIPIFMGSDGHPYMEINDSGNAYAIRLGGTASNLVLRTAIATKIGRQPKTSELRDITNELVAQAEHSGVTRDVNYRCAPFQNGVELDMGDAQHTRIRITPGKVAIVKQGSNTLFRRTSAMQPFVVPAEIGDLKLLDKYINAHAIDRKLLKAWISFTLAQPKTSDTNYVFLALQGGQGTGKSLLCKIIQLLIDPSIIGVQTFPHNDKELVIAAQNSHVLFYDNMRSISPQMADKLCIASTGGVLSTRRLYTDDEQHLHKLHAPFVLNGIHPFIDQPDLAQRFLTLHLPPLNEKERRTESDILRELKDDLPRIFRGLLDLIADVLKHLPDVEVTDPERMLEYVHWLASMERSAGIPAGIFQGAYSDALNQTMLEGIQENPLAATILIFVDEHVDDVWTGTPTELLDKLNFLANRRTQYLKEWPSNSIALSKRLKALQTALTRQGIEIEFFRGKERKITITRREGTNHG